jgi:transmembrane sensor
MASDAPTSGWPEIEHQAAAWLARRDRGLTAAEQDAFFQWLAEDPRHGEWLARHQQTVAGLKLLAQWKPEHGTRPNPDLLAWAPPAPAQRSSALLRWLVPVSLAAAFAVVFWRPHYGSTAVQAPETAPAPIVRRVLEDGSTIDLNSGADVTVDYSATRRVIRLVRGEAHFAVAKNPERPFVVHVNHTGAQLASALKASASEKAADGGDDAVVGGSTD